MKLGGGGSGTTDRVAIWKLRNETESRRTILLLVFGYRYGVITGRHTSSYSFEDCEKRIAVGGNSRRDAYMYVAVVAVRTCGGPVAL